MGTIRNIVLAWVFCLSQHGLAQESTPIAWDVSRKLAWEDFKGKPFKTAWAAATTASGISYEYTGRETKGGYELEFSVGAYFYPEKSWYQPHLCDALVLSHEQLHFDISELFARKLRKQLVAARQRSRRSITGCFWNSTPISRATTRRPITPATPINNWSGTGRSAMPWPIPPDCPEADEGRANRPSRLAIPGAPGPPRRQVWSGRNPVNERAPGPDAFAPTNYTSQMVTPCFRAAILSSQLGMNSWAT